MKSYKMEHNIDLYLYNREDEVKRSMTFLIT